MASNSQQPCNSHRKIMSGRQSLLFIVLTTIGWSTIRSVHGHGYLSSPRSRNLLAAQETKWWNQTSNDPLPETCPHCLNRGGTLARCGLVGDAGGGVRNYDTPKNAFGEDMPISIQANYTQGQAIILNVSLTAHHRGHFEFKACPISPGEIPSQECFDSNPLEFVFDLLYGANYDRNYPQRAYLSPPNNPNYVLDVGSTTGVMDFSFVMRLPPTLYGDLVLIQWYYLTANSCYHPGYREYIWPSTWNIDATSTLPCGEISPDGDGVPEQFFNCAEVRIKGPDDDDEEEVAESHAPPRNKLYMWVFIIALAFIIVNA